LSTFVFVNIPFCTPGFGLCSPKSFYFIGEC
jgi:hypothetical protein